MPRKFCKIIPNLDPQRTKTLNLTVLRRIDCLIEEILITVTHVSLYGFNVDTSQWSRKDVEGSMFVVKRAAEPRFQFIVMNRRNTENLVENLFGDFKCQVRGPYLLYRNVSQEVNGIWFYDQRECEAVASLFSWILDESSKVSPVAKSEFEELGLGQGMPLVGTSQDSTLTAPAATVDCPEDSLFAKFFGAATTSGGASDVLNARQTYYSSTTDSLACHIPNVVSTSLPPPQMPLLPLSSVAILDKIGPVSSDNQVINPVKPSFFASSISSPLPPAAPALQPPTSLNRPAGTPLLHLFPPPTPPKSLNSSPAGATSPSISRNKVRDALVLLIQDDQFIDMFYRAMLKADRSSATGEPKGI